ncbi:hypothetical protein E2C01_072203 [Portunus trituberculatus]|uniref:Uncharacterized protein n=1 Tax=Portunus trituberculatus TaxID=210409 RepID=A0A5B7I8B4_PORTR|nr:hypothetical protein [Portunus trituberculatus]
MGKGWGGQPRIVALLEATRARPGSRASEQASAGGLTSAGFRRWLPGGNGGPKEKCGEGGGSGGNGRAVPGFGQRLPYNDHVSASATPDLTVFPLTHTHRASHTGNPRADPELPPPPTHLAAAPPVQIGSPCITAHPFIPTPRCITPPIIPTKIHAPPYQIARPATGRGPAPSSRPAPRPASPPDPLKMDYYLDLS